MPVTRGFFRKRPPGPEGRLPPGQYDVGGGWPVLTAEATPRVRTEDWTLAVDGLVDRPTTYTWDEIHRLPRATYSGDIHCVTTWSKFDVTFAGVSVDDLRRTFAPSKRTADGHEPNFQVNHLAPYLLTHLVRPQLVAAGRSLVVNTSSIGNLVGKVVLDDLDYEHRRAFELTAYGTGKLMNILFTRGISQRWAADGIVSVAVHPGPVGSSFGRDSWIVGLAYRTPLRRLATISVPDGAAPLIALAERGPAPEIDGHYFSRFSDHGRENRQTRDQAIIDGLWERSAALVGVA